ncbi:MAG: YggT family protein [Proteobacteria bacterium]|nr:YggT family protein [Pseudomonadota bacterium]
MIPFINYIFQALQIIIFASVLMSWLNLPMTHPVVKGIYQITEPVYDIIRRVTKNFFHPLDIAPMVCLLVLFTLQRIIMSLLQ